MQTQFFQMDASLSKREYFLGRNPFKVFNVEIYYKIHQAPTGTLTHLPSKECPSFRIPSYGLSLLSSLLSSIEALLMGL